jgi:hypothetical protein
MRSAPAQKGFGNSDDQPLFAAPVKGRHDIAAITRTSRQATPGMTNPATAETGTAMVVKSVTAIAEIAGVTQPWLAQTIWLWLLLQPKSSVAGQVFCCRSSLPTKVVFQPKSVLAEETSDAGD